MSDFRVEQDFGDNPQLHLFGTEDEAYAYLKHWRFPESSMMWVVDEKTGKRIGSNEWFAAVLRRKIEDKVFSALTRDITYLGIGEYNALTEAYVDQIMEIVNE